MSFIAVYVTTDVCKLDDIMRYLAIIELADADVGSENSLLSRSLQCPKD